MGTTMTCPLCGVWNTPADMTKGDAWTFRCANCGVFTATGSFVALYGDKERRDALPEVDRELLRFVGCYTRQRGKTAETIDFGNWQGCGEAHSHTTVEDKIEKLLRYAANVEGVGKQFALGGSDGYAIDAPDTDEFSFLVHALQESRQLEPGRDRGYYVVTRQGWNRLRELPADGAQRGLVFVAMWFDDKLLPAFERGIVPAVKAAIGRDPQRLDRVEYNGKICDRILADIRRCEFLIADVTEHRSGVYFEAGYAMGLGRPVIWTCRKDQIDRCHTDTRQYFHIVWETPEELRDKLRDRILATIIRAAH